MEQRETASLETPIGTVAVTGTATVIERIAIGVGAGDADATSPAVREALAQLAAYFDGRLAAFHLPLPPSSTPRGSVLRAAIVAVQAGDTAGYGEIARRIGSSPRAIGQACARNPLPIVVPCHRILAAGGVLGPYSAGEGPVTKRWLLDHERRWATGQLRLWEEVA